MTKNYNETRKEEFNMKITEIKIRKTYTEGNLRATVSVVLENCLAIHDIKVIQGNSRLFVAMHARKGEDGIYKDTIHPIHPDIRAYFEETILEAYEQYIAFESVMDNYDAQ